MERSAFDTSASRGDLVVLALTVVALWFKQLYAGLALQTIWPEHSLESWAIQHAAIFASTLGGALLLTAWTLMLRRGVRLAALLLLNLMATTLIVADYVYIYFAGDVLSVLDTLGSPAMAGAVIASLLDWMNPGLAWFYADIVAGVVLLAATRGHVVPPDTRPRRGRIRIAVALSALGAVLTAPAVATVTLSEDGVFAFDALQRDVWATLGAMPYHAADVIIHSRGVTAPPDEAPLVKSYFDRFATPPPASPAFGAARGANLILISAESLQAFPLSLQIQGVAVAPRLAAFAAESLSFTQFYDQTHLGTTSDGEFVSLNSLHPTPVGFVVYRYAANTFAALPSLLRQTGYATASAVGAPGDFWNMNHMHRQYGFDASFYDDSYRMDEQIGGWLGDRSFFAQTVPRLVGLPRPFFAFLLTSSNHHPFDGHSSPATLDIGVLRGTLLGDYLQSVNEFDTAFGTFLDGLRAANLLDQTVVALYGDHQGYIGHDAGLPSLLGYEPDDELQRFLVRKRVPFLVRLPGGRHAGPRDEAGGHLDIAPTLASLMGVAAAPMMLGRDRTVTRGGPVVFRDGSFLDRGVAYINAFGVVSSARCYELATGNRVDCQAFIERRATAREQLRVSDAILAGNLLRP